MQKATNQHWAFFVARLTIGINFLIHGLVRIPKLRTFAESLTQEFTETFLPTFLVTPFAYALPFIEFILGVLLILGWKTRFGAITGGLLIAILLLGMGIQEDWGGVGNLMVYAIFFFLFIKNLDFNILAIDTHKKTTIDGFKP